MVDKISDWLIGRAGSGKTCDVSIKLNTLGKIFTNHSKSFQKSRPNVSTLASRILVSPKQ